MGMTVGDQHFLKSLGRGVWVPAFAGTTRSVRKRRGGNYASPSVSNIAALMASVAVFPAQTTNWNAG